MDPQLVFDAIKGGLAGSTVMNAKAPMMIGGDDKPGFKIDLHIKDLNNALDCAHSVGTPMPMTAQVQEVLQWLHSHGCGQDDHSSIIKYYKMLPGIHTHIEFNSVNLNCDGKFVNVKDSYLVLRRLNDELCRAHGLSIIENPKPTAKEHKQKELAAAKRGVSWKERLRQNVDRVLPDCRNYDDFLAKMRAEGYEIKEGKKLSFRAPGQERFKRSSCLGDNYTREALRDRFTVRRGPVTSAKMTFRRDGRKINLLIDIQAKMAAGKGAGYEHWAKIFNLKEAAKTLNFLIENGLTDYDELAVKAEQAGTRFDNAARRIKQLEGRLAEVAQLKTHIINYSKTREIYAAYKKSRHKKEFLAEHGAEIAQHEAAKKAFDALGASRSPR